MSKREKVLSKIRALLDQAESTDYEEEADRRQDRVPTVLR